MADELIESILNESRSFPPSKEFSDQANINAEKAEEMKKLAADDHIKYWAKLANEELRWSRPFSNTFDDSKAPNYEWFNDGEINASYNSLDVNVSKNPDKTAIIFEKEDGKSEFISYKELLLKTSQFANGLKKIGVKPMDRVVIYMPMCPEAVIAMQACARIGAIHSVVFGGFASNELASRIDDSKAQVLITASCGFEPGRTVEYKPLVDEALKLADRIAIMKDGIIEQLDTPDNIVLNPATEYVKKFTEDVPREKVLKIESIMDKYDQSLAGNNTVSKDAIIETVAESILDSKENLTVIDVNNDNKPIGILQPKKVITVLFGK